MEQQKFQMRNLIFLLTLFIIVGFSSCKKDNNQPAIDYIEFGNPEASYMNTYTFSPEMQIASWSNGGYVYDSIDVFNDGKYDILFVSFGQKWAHSSFCTIESINDSVEVLVEAVNDSTFLTYNNQNPLVDAQKVMWNSFSGFESFSQNDSLTNTRIEYCTRLFKYGDVLNLSDNGLSGKPMGVFARYSEGYSYDYNFYNHFRLGYWNDEGEKYLCFKIKNGGTRKYGWIKASIENNIAINVFEYAVNK